MSGLQPEKRRRMTKSIQSIHLSSAGAPDPTVTVVIPSMNQSSFLAAALASVYAQEVPVEIFVMDGGSTDGSLEIIRDWEGVLSGWRSGPDGGQAAAINAGISMGRAPYVTWLNSDDLMLPGALAELASTLDAAPNSPVAYGRAWNVVEETGRRHPVWVQPFSEQALALRCIVSQPAALIRRSAWEAVGGLDIKLHMALDYDLWWRLYRARGPFTFVNRYVAVNRDHRDTKTNKNRRLHYDEAIATVRRNHGRVPLKWYLLQPYAVHFKQLLAMLKS